MVRTAIGIGLAIVALTGWVWNAQAQEKGPKRLGTYTYVSGKEGDHEIPREQLKGTVKVTEDMILLLDEQGKETFAISYKVANDEEPYRIDMKIERSVMADAVGATARGLGKFQDGQAMVIYDYSEHPDYPDDFTPEAQQHLFVLKPSGD